MKRLQLLAASSVALVACFASRSARADDQPGPRFRFGVSATAGVISQQERYTGGSEWGNEIAVPGLALRAGVQLDDRYAIFYQGSASIFLPTVRNAVMFEVTPVRWFSVGAGASVNYFQLSGGGCAFDVTGTCSQNPPPAQEAWSVGVPVRLALNMPFHVSPKSGRRLGVSFNVDVTPAYSFGGPGLPSGFQLGSVAGLGFEMF